VNHPPLLRQLGPLEAVFGRPLNFYLPAKDPDGDRIFFSADNLPANAQFYPDTGFFRWSPRLDQLGDYTFEFSVSDDGTPSLATSESVSVRVVYRTVEREKGAFGFLSGEQVVAEARSLPELYPRVAKIIINGNQAAPEAPSLEVSSQPTIEIEVASPFRVDPASLTVTVNGVPVGISHFYNVKALGGRSNIVSLRFKVAQLRFVPGPRYNLSVRAANELGGTRGSWQLVVAGDQKKKEQSQ
jgi:hypothetical protein